ncbi:MAG TPA: nucleotidyltransferase domain-containing protein [Polyangiaceae bacterium]
MDLLAARIERRADAARARADALRARLPECVRVLRGRGATRVVLFGSLATGAAPHERTDVDLAVWGLSERDVLDVALDLEEIFGASLDIVSAECAGQRLLARIARDGVELG